MIKKNFKQENSQDTKLLTSNICTDDGTLLTDLISLFNNFKFIPQENRTVNIDDITESGIIQVIDASSGTLPIDMPSGRNNFFLITLVRIEDNPYRRQILLDIRTTNIYTRHRGASGWLPWISLNNNYYNDEQIIGVWIDGKPIYRKVFFNYFSDEYNNWYSIGNISNLKTVIKVEGMIKQKNDGNFIDFPRCSTFDNTSSDLYINGSTGEVNIRIGKATGELYLIVDYTKTTD